MASVKDLKNRKPALRVEIPGGRSYDLYDSEEVGPPQPLETKKKYQDIVKYAPHLIDQAREAAKNTRKYKDLTHSITKKYRDIEAEKDAEKALDSFADGLTEKDWKTISEQKVPTSIDKDPHTRSNVKIFGNRTTYGLYDLMESPLVTGHEMGHVYGARDLYEENSKPGQDRKHKPHLMDTQQFGNSLINKLIERGLPRQEAVKAVAEELSYPEEDFQVPIQPRLDEKGEVEWKDGKTQPRRKWAKKPNPYKDWDDWDVRADEYAERRIPSPVYRTPVK